MEYAFSEIIRGILLEFFPKNAKDIYEKSSLLQYIDIKTRSANRGSKSRGSFANLYAIYVLVEDYLSEKYDTSGKYSKYSGAQFINLYKRQRELPFGSKLQNHALNHRMNEEFKKYFNHVKYIPILRDAQTNRYWFNENLLKIESNKKIYNIAKAVIRIIDEYIKMKRSSFEAFIQTCERLKTIPKKSINKVQVFILGLLDPNVDARLFEIVSYSILKFYYHDQTIYMGWELETIEEENLKLYKTGRTNANDGGIDFVMTPLGRFFQVTETLDVKKYFLDIDKIEHYPISFIVKTSSSVEIIIKTLKEGAVKQFSIDAIVKKYMASIDEIINIPVLKDRFIEAKNNGYLTSILDEIIKQSKVEFNYDEETDITEEDDDE